MSIEYTSLEAAAEIIGNRRADDALQRRLRDFLGGELADGPYADSTTSSLPAVRAEYLARPTAGDLDFLQTARELGFDPWTVTYEGDAYLASNEKKANMYRPRLALPRGQMARLKIVRNGQWEGYPIGDIPTTYGIPLGEWWRALRAYKLERTGLASLQDNVYDIGDWYKSQALDNGAKQGDSSIAGAYYPRLMGLYAARAALFTCFPLDFTRIAVPAFEQVSEALGVSPVVVRWLPDSSYPAQELGVRMVKECEVDLSDQVGLDFDGLPDWLRREAQCVNQD